MQRMLVTVDNKADSLACDKCWYREDTPGQSLSQIAMRKKRVSQPSILLVGVRRQNRTTKLGFSE